MPTPFAPRSSSALAVGLVLALAASIAVPGLIGDGDGGPAQRTATSPSAPPASAAPPASGAPSSTVPLSPHAPPVVPPTPVATMDSVEEWMAALRETPEPEPTWTLAPEPSWTVDAASSGSAAAPVTSYATSAVRADADWILEAQHPSGAIATHVDQKHVYPYLAGFAAIGLTRASARTGDRRYTQAAWRYLRWYASKQDRNGYVTDYVARGGVLRSTGDMDSTDAYAGLYLLAVRAAYRQSGDRAQLRALQPSLRMAVQAIRSTQDRDGLTWAKPSWRVKYLMDQAETYAGLRAAGQLGRVLGDRTLSSRADASATRLRRGVDSLWNPRTGTYDWAEHANGARTATDWNRLYPDALQQAWAVAFGLVPQRRANALMRTFQAKQRNWARPGASARFDSGRRPVGYWAPVGWALQQTGLSAAGATGFRSIRGAALAQRRAWPFTPSDSGQLIVLGSGTAGDIRP